MEFRSNKAITLVALIITIIILLILVGVSLSMVLGENGLINKAQSSVNKYKESSENEQKLLNSIESYMDLQLKTPGEKVELPDGWNKNTVDAVLDDKKNVIPVPKNFYYVGGNLDNGVIISDNSADAYDGKVDKTTWEYTTSLVGNQFVWIPCTEEEYHKTDWGSQYVHGGYDKSEPSQEEIDKVNSLIDKSEKKGKNERTILLHKIKNVDFDILISKFSSYICSYVPLSDGTILILDIAHKTKGYDESVNILRRNLNTIKDIRNEAKEKGTERLFESQKEYRDSLRDKYGLNTSKMNEVKL